MAVRRHIYREAIVLQFSLRNPVPDQIWKDGRIVLSQVPGELELTEEAHCGQLGPGETGTAYAVLKCDREKTPFPIARLRAKLIITVVEIDPDTASELGSYSDEHPLSDVALTVSNYIRGVPLNLPQFKYVSGLSNP